MSANALRITLPSDTEIAMIREFDAPRALVFDAMTRPELIRQWMSGPPGWSFLLCEVDLRPGGAYRYVWGGPDGTTMGMGGVHREIVVPERIVATQLFDQDWTGGEAISTMTFAERDGRTTVVTTMRYSSKAARDAVLETPMEQGVAMGYDRLESLFPTLSRRQPMEKITPFLWFDGQADEAMRFYCSVFGNSRVVSVHRIPGTDTVVSATFELEGRTFHALNGGPRSSFTPAISFLVDCETQEEVDRLWDRLCADGGQPGMCGWLKDRFGVSWQIIPKALGRLLSSEDQGRAKRAMDAMLTMRKIVISELEAAAAGQ